MPFLVEISVPELDGKAATLVERLVLPDGYVGWDKPIALADIGGVRTELICNMPVVIDEWNCSPGDQMASGKLLVTAQAEGDEIPYGKPYARFEAEQPRKER
ncbi:hypothetical protein [Sphingomonas bacterium]|uniref:hypothetical protein n=1 Tax=Sphingomonas bacterium TaxID=1895847 RepID=UPI0026065106|nr:hypothetical protein [Sphingomonas bacterium]MDB5679703.1 hypothetical protein [Sphingomonas bacterium]